MGAQSSGSVIGFNQCDLNIVGSPNSPMTLQFSAPGTLAIQVVNLVGYDAS
jgi:hypothetical protein